MGMRYTRPNIGSHSAFNQRALFDDIAGQLSIVLQSMVQTEHWERGFGKEGDGCLAQAEQGVRPWREASCLIIL